jgi:hypothetical protein
MSRVVALALPAALTIALLSGCQSASPWPAAHFPTATPLPGGYLHPIASPTANTDPSASNPASDASGARRSGG